MTTDRKLKQEIVDTCKVIDGMGLVEGFGHVSVRKADSLMVITPAKAIGLVTTKDLITFSLDGEAVEGSECDAPLERWMHLAVYQTRPDVQAICRTHSQMTAVFGAANKCIYPVHGFGGMLGSQVPVHFENDLITTMEMGFALAETLAQRCAVMLRGNGALAVGACLSQSCVRAIFLEEAAKIQHSALSIGEAIPFTNDELKSRSRWYELEEKRAWEYYKSKYSG